VAIIGVCLGHQCIGQVFGVDVVRSGSVMHGKTSVVHHTGAGVLAGLPDPFEATRYHSLVVERSSLPDVLAEVLEVLVDELVVVVDDQYARAHSHDGIGVCERSEPKRTAEGRAGFAGRHGARFNSVANLWFATEVNTSTRRRRCR
jgi:hypothetical protein